MYFRYFISNYIPKGHPGCQCDMFPTHLYKTSSYYACVPIAASILHMLSNLSMTQKDHKMCLKQLFTTIYPGKLTEATNKLLSPSYTFHSTFL